MPRDVDSALYRDVWIYVEHSGGRPATVSWELVGAARNLADDLGEAVVALVLGHDIEHLAEESFAHGADRVILVDDPLLDPYLAETHAVVLANLVERHRPGIFLLGATAIGREVAGSVATAVAGGLTADATGLAVDRDRRLLEATRPTFGGKQMATIVCERWRPQMATVRPGVMPLPERREGAAGELVRAPAGLAAGALATWLIERVEAAGEGEDLDRADVVVAGGRGIGGADGFALLHELAEVLGGAVGATRPAVDAGWIGKERQIGQTGKTIRPRLYFAVAISGAIQHTVGMDQARTVIAINRDAAAPIFRLADYGIVGDWREVVPALAEEFRVRLRRPAVTGTGGGWHGGGD